MLAPLMASKATTTKRMDSDFYVEGYATTFDKPYLIYEYDGIQFFEAIDRNALNGADMSDVIMQYDHHGRVLARLSNKTLGLEADNTGLFTFADLSKTDASRGMYNDIDTGMITKMSWAFRVSKDAYDQDTRTRTILRIKKVYDVSAVSLPANADTEISARSYLDGVIGEDFFNGVIEGERRRAMTQQRLLLQLKLNRRNTV